MAQKVKISVLKDLVNGNIGLDDIPFEVKEYLPFKDKVALIDRVVALSLVETNGVSKINHIFKQFFYEIELLRAYTNLDFSAVDKHRNDVEKYVEKLVAFYDLLKQSGVLDALLHRIPTEEKVFIKNCIDKQVVEQQQVENSLANMIGKLIDVINNKIPEMEQAIKNFKPEDFKFVVDALKLNNSLPE